MSGKWSEYKCMALNSCLENGKWMSLLIKIMISINEVLPFLYKPLSPFRLRILVGKLAGSSAFLA